MFSARGQTGKLKVMESREAEREPKPYRKWERHAECSRIFSEACFRDSVLRILKLRISEKAVGSIRGRACTGLPEKKGSVPLMSARCTAKKAISGDAG